MLASNGSVLQSDGQNHQREKDFFQNSLYATRCVGPQNGKKLHFVFANFKTLNNQFYHLPNVLSVAQNVSLMIL